MRDRVSSDAGEVNEIWIGLAGVSPRPENDLLEGSSGAYVNVLAPADSAFSFSRVVKEALDRMGFDLDELEDVETLEAGMQKFEIDSELLELANSVRATGEVRFGTFHGFEFEDEDVDEEES